VQTNSPDLQANDTLAHDPSFCSGVNVDAVGASRNPNNNTIEFNDNGTVLCFGADFNPAPPCVSTIAQVPCRPYINLYTCIYILCV